MIWLFACSPASDDSGPLPADSADVLDSGDTAGGGLFAPPSGFFAADALTVEADRGLVWERDPEWSLGGFTVPQVWVTAAGGYALMVSNMADTTGRWRFSSPDGLDWSAETRALLEPTDFAPLDCGTRLEDGAMLYEPDGSFRLIVEGTLPIEGDKHVAWRRWCQATSADGVTFTPDTQTPFFDGAEDDAGQPSVPATLPLADWTQLVGYVGALYTEADGIRFARASGSPWALTRVSEPTVFPRTDVDPDPVYVAGGGVRVYHTHGKDGGPGYGELDADFVAQQDVLLLDNAQPDCGTSPGDCILDPAYLRLPDGRMVLYFTWLRADGAGGLIPAIGRAFAVD